jgi:hypothetical protein
VDVTLLKRVLFALFTDYRLWIAAGGGLFFLLIASLVADRSEGMKLTKVGKGEAKKLPGLKMPKMPKLPSLRKKKEAPPPELDDDDPSADGDAK